MTSFTQFQAEQDARNTIQLNVRKWCLMLIDALKDDYRAYAIRGHKQSMNRADITSSGVEYHNRCIEELSNELKRNRIFLSEGINVGQGLDENQFVAATSNHVKTARSYVTLSRNIEPSIH